MLRTELFRLMKSWTTEEIKTFMCTVLFPMSKERILDAVMSVVSDNEINDGLFRMGKSERIT